MGVEVEADIGGGGGNEYVKGCRVIDYFNLNEKTFQFRRIFSHLCGHLTGGDKTSRLYSIAQSA